MLPDADALVREVDLHLRELESLVDRLASGVVLAQRKVEALEWMRKALEAFGGGDALNTIASNVGPMRERVRVVEEKLRASLGPLSASGTAAPSTPCAAGNGAVENGSPASTFPEVEPCDTNGPHHQNGHAQTEYNINPAQGTAPASDEQAPPRNGARTVGFIPIEQLAQRYVPPRYAMAQLQATDPADLERIRELEEECEREFAKLPFVHDDERHALLIVCAAKARRLRTRLHDSYAVDRRLGDLIRKIVDLKRRHRLGWIDGCERGFDVPDWDAYVERCEEHYRELKIREQARAEEARVARQRVQHLQSEIERRGRELRHYLDTEEGRLGAEPEKLRAVLMSYLAVDGALDPELLERLRVHKQLFTGIAFRRLRKGLERPPLGTGFPSGAFQVPAFDPPVSGPADESEWVTMLQRAREQLHARTRGARAILFAPYAGDEMRRRSEELLGFDRLGWVDVTALDPAAWHELNLQITRGEVHYILRSAAQEFSPYAEAQLADALKAGPIPCVQVERADDAEVLFANVVRAICDGDSVL